LVLMVPNFASWFSFARFGETELERIHFQIFVAQLVDDSLFELSCNSIGLFII